MTGLAEASETGIMMQNRAQTVARLRSMVFLIEEALRIADEGDHPLLGAKLSDCVDCLERALAVAGGTIVTTEG